MHGSAQGLAVKLMTISFMGGGRSMPDWAGGTAELSVSHTAWVTERTVVGGCGSLEADFNKPLHKLGRIISSTALVLALTQSPAC